VRRKLFRFSFCRGGKLALDILFVENNAYFFNAVKKEFLSDHDIINVPSIKKAVAVLHEKKFDIVLVDYDLDDGKGAVLVKEIRVGNPYLPIVAVSSHEKGNIELISSGANAQCAKLDFKEINTVIQSVLV